MTFSNLFYPIKRTKKAIKNRKIREIFHLFFNIHYSFTRKGLEPEYRESKMEEVVREVARQPILVLIFEVLFDWKYQSIPYVSAF